MKIKAYIKNSPDEAIHLGELEVYPKDTDVIVRTTHVGLAQGDVFILENKWNDTVYPAVGTGENVGIVEHVGKETKGFAVGDRVGIGYIVKSCMQCEYCEKGLYHYCRKQVNTESGGWGGFAEKIVIDYRLIAKIPDALESDAVTPLTCYGLTAYSAVLKAQLIPHSRVGIIGLGGLGHMLLEIAVAMGHDVTIFSHSPEKQVIAKKLGASAFVLSTSQDLTDNYAKSFDLIINTSHGDFQLQDYLQLLTPEGKFCYIGLPFNTQSFRPTQLADYGSRCIYGSYVGSIAELHDLFTLAATKEIKPEIVTYPIAKYEEAMRFVKSGNSYKRVVLYW